MVKHIAFDVGKSRIGVAISEDGQFAFPHSTIQVYAIEQAVQEAAYLIEDEVGQNTKDTYNDAKIYIGLPIDDRNQEAAVAPYIHEFAELLTPLIYPIVPEFIDERYTTRMAHNQLHELGKAPSRNRHIIDQMAAVNILESALKMS